MSPPLRPSPSVRFDRTYAPGPQDASSSTKEKEIAYVLELFSGRNDAESPGGEPVSSHTTWSATQRPQSPSGTRSAAKPRAMTVAVRLRNQGKKYLDARTIKVMLP